MNESIACSILPHCSGSVSVKDRMPVRQIALIHVDSISQRKIVHQICDIIDKAKVKCPMFSLR